LLLGAVALAGPAPAVAQAKKSDTVVKVSAKGDKIGVDGKQTVTVTMAMEGKWYVYANPVGLEDFADNATVVTVTGKNKLAGVKVEYPKPTVVKDKVLGDYKVYKEKAVIRAVVQRARGDTGPLKVSVRFMSCNGNTCLLPATVELKVP
jgi:hypothetical protein